MPKRPIWNHINEQEMPRHQQKIRQCTLSSVTSPTTNPSVLFRQEWGRRGELVITNHQARQGPEWKVAHKLSLNWSHSVDYPKFLCKHSLGEITAYSSSQSMHLPTLPGEA